MCKEMVDSGARQLYFCKLCSAAQKVYSSQGEGPEIWWRQKSTSNIYLLYYGDSYFDEIWNFNFYMVSNCSIWSLIFKRVFVFDVRPFLLLSIKFFGFNGNFNGKMTKIDKMAKNHFSGVQKCGTHQNAQNGSFWVFWAILGVPKMALRVPK